MPQELNLNVSPYYDDFDRDNDYYRVLFKPGYPVQARELTTMQSMLQSQLEKFSDHFFKEGKAILDNSGLKLISAENLDDAAKKIVEAIK